MGDTQDNQEFTVEEADTNGTTSAESSQSSAHSDRDDNSQEAQKSKPSLPPIFQQIRAQLNTLMASQTMTALSKALTVLHSVFKKRPRFPYLLYIMVMAIVDSAAVLYSMGNLYGADLYRPEHSGRNHTAAEQHPRSTHALRRTDVDGAKIHLAA